MAEQKNSNVVEMYRTQRTAKGLRDTLFHELDLLMNGMSNPQKSKGVSSIANSIVSTVKMEISQYRYASALTDPRAAKQLGALELATPLTETSDKQEA